MGCRFFSIVIPTYNRCHLIGRAIESVLSQDMSSFEVIVVDDASTDNTAITVSKSYPSVTYMRQEHNMGPGAARNRGIREAAGEWIVLLDDDDTLLPGALEDIARCIEALPEKERYPVVQFARSNAVLRHSFLMADLSAYFKGELRGDFAPVIQKEVFLKAGFAYPVSPVGAEHLLWWQVAERFGIPTWNKTIMELHDDASVRLTDFTQQIAKARWHAEAQETTLSLFGEKMRQIAPKLLEKKIMGLIVYSILAGERSLARAHLKRWSSDISAPYLYALMILSFLPLPLVRRAFLAYRGLTGS